MAEASVGGTVDDGPAPEETESSSRPVEASTATRAMATSTAARGPNRASAEARGTGVEVGGVMQAPDGTRPSGR